MRVPRLLPMGMPSRKRHRRNKPVKIRFQEGAGDRALFSRSVPRAHAQREGLPTEWWQQLEGPETAGTHGLAG